MQNGFIFAGFLGIVCFSILRTHYCILKNTNFLENRNRKPFGVLVYYPKTECLLDKNAYFLTNQIECSIARLKHTFSSIIIIEFELKFSQKLP
ncbi:hypothetical protein PHSC3_001846 [Chlamydiales bacterium STE3]|nr:hypothetical protein PHSC3_001846 [Chlamydiales bacterium STE3]